MGKRVAVIGAGACGLVAVKCCRDEQLETVCFEQSHDIGGLWRYTDTVTDGQACVMKSTTINTSKEIMAFSDFPPPKDFPNFMHNTKIMEYFRLYAKKFELDKYIKFGQRVVRVEKCGDFKTSGQWSITIQDLSTNSESVHLFDGVLICTGHHADKKMVSFPRQNEFQGEIIHTHDYRNFKGFEDKTVVIVGIGNSAGDVAVELSKVCKQVFMSTRRGTWLTHRIGERGEPADLIFNRRFIELMKSVMSERKFNDIVEKQLEQRIDHTRYGLRPEFRFSEQHPMVNDELPNRIICGTVIIKPDVQHFTRTGLKFVDGSMLDQVDVVLMATGYVFGFPFLDEKVVKVVHNKVDLYKYCFPPDLEHPTLAIIGCVQPWGATPPIGELQSRLAARVIKGVVSLPSSANMWRDIRAKRQEIARRFIGTSRHTLEVEAIPFMDELADHIGCKPKLWRLLFRDFPLFMACFLGPCTPLQYRLHGPGSWPGAREAILTIDERVRAPLQTRPLPMNKSTVHKRHGMKLIVFGAAVVIVAVYCQGSYAPSWNSWKTLE